MTAHDPTLEPALDVSTIEGVKADGKTHVAELIEAAIHALPGRMNTESSEGRTRPYGAACVYFPPGTYYFERGIRIPANINVALVGAGAALSVITTLAARGTSPHKPGVHVDPVVPLPSQPLLLPPPYITPGYRGTMDQPGATFATGQIKAMSDWLVPGTLLPWDTLWEPYFAYVQSHYAVYFTGLNTSLSTFKAVTGKPNPTDLEVAAVKQGLLDNGWGKWLERNLLGWGDGGTPWEVRDLTFRGGGILVAGDGGESYGGGGQKRGAVSHCRFVNTRGWGLATEDQRVVSVNVKHCRFESCSGGIGIRYAQSDNWVISDCDFSGTRGIDLQIATANVTVDSCRFWGKPSSARDYPFVHLKSLPGRWEIPGAVFLGDVVSPQEFPGVSQFSARNWYSAVELGRGVRLVDCTLGADGRCPDDLIVVGPWDVPPHTSHYDLPRQADLPLPTPIPAAGQPVRYVTIPVGFTSFVDGLLIEGCRFGAADSISGVTAPRSAIRLATAVRDLAAVRCMAGQMTFFIYEQLQEKLWEGALVVAVMRKDPTNQYAAQGFSSDGNWGNSLEVVPLPGLPRALEPFSFGGRGFEVVGSVTAELAGRRGFPGLLNLLGIAGDPNAQPGMDWGEGVEEIWKGKHSDRWSLTDVKVRTAGTGEFEFIPKLAPQPALSGYDPRVHLFIDTSACAKLSTWNPLSPTSNSTALPPLVLAFEARTDDPTLQYAAAVGLGIFGLAGSPTRRIAASSSWQSVVLTVPPLPAAWTLPSTPPSWWVKAAAPLDTWAGVMSAASKGLASVFSGGNGDFNFAMAVAFWVRGDASDESGTGLMIRRLRLLVGDLSGPYRAIGGTSMTSTVGDTISPTSFVGADSDGHAGWRAQPLGNQLVSAGSFAKSTAVPSPVDALQEIQPAVDGPSLHLGNGDPTPVGEVLP